MIASSQLVHTSASPRFSQPTSSHLVRQELQLDSGREENVEDAGGDGGGASYLSAQDFIFGVILASLTSDDDEVEVQGSACGQAHSMEVGMSSSSLRPSGLRLGTAKPTALSALLSHTASLPSTTGKSTSAPSAPRATLLTKARSPSETGSRSSLRSRVPISAFPASDEDEV
ncbi:hypothetical protein CF326_g8361 [Tilletia indica]|uniref:Uncharacterized protein n=1 Tax=Tilletia indica TaxID=43049 RepID=A0A177TJ78_9BASI|nr:hypothetical protein CF326_g8361 [Tilletia indica]KAE8241005.1 hypothetical protein A4X13_0g7606 [Tilletia indica]